MALAELTIWASVRAPVLHVWATAGVSRYQRGQRALPVNTVVSLLWSLYSQK